MWSHWLEDMRKCHYPLALTHFAVSAVGSESRKTHWPPEITVHEPYVQVASLLHRAALSQASPLWLRASRGHPGWPRCSHLSMERKVCLSSIWSIKRYRSQAFWVGLADRSVHIGDFQPRQAQLKESANPFLETPPCLQGVTSSTRWLIVVEPPVWVLIVAQRLLS